MLNFVDVQIKILYHLVYSNKGINPYCWPVDGQEPWLQSLVLKHTCAPLRSIHSFSSFYPRLAPTYQLHTTLLLAKAFLKFISTAVKLEDHQAHWWENSEHAFWKSIDRGLHYWLGIMLFWVSGYPPSLISSASMAELTEIKANRGFMQLSSHICPYRPLVWLNQT